MFCCEIWLINTRPYYNSKCLYTVDIKDSCSGCNYSRVCFKKQPVCSSFWSHGASAKKVTPIQIGKQKLLKLDMRFVQAVSQAVRTEGKRVWGRQMHGCLCMWACEQKRKEKKQILQYYWRCHDISGGGCRRITHAYVGWIWEGDQVFPASLEKADFLCLPANLTVRLGGSQFGWISHRLRLQTA